ncbi:hypothetical protein J5Y04_37240 [Kitasatospora sp. RG8]|uniref:hypothetical protein n=1 Tax=Kitasatospora sp. RG8 TaxID=2820815 RepID=UPI001ADF1614|nr:hypothetical protein [Kitasatospora sp. RG8]MBP0455122.1 hypothetical protein [Kitasatospora sp. RG8]
MRHDDPLDHSGQITDTLTNTYHALQSAYSEDEAQAAKRLSMLQARAAAETKAEARACAGRKRACTTWVPGQSSRDWPGLDLLALVLKAAASTSALANAVTGSVIATLVALTIAGRLSVHVTVPLATTVGVLRGLPIELPHRLDREREQRRSKDL